MIQISVAAARTQGKQFLFNRDVKVHQEMKWHLKNSSFTPSSIITVRNYKVEACSDTDVNLGCSLKVLLLKVCILNLLFISALVFAKKRVISALHSAAI